MMRRTTTLVVLGMLAWATLHAQQWERIANPLGGPFGETFRVAEVDGWTVVSAGAAAVWRTRTPEQMGSMERINVTFNGLQRPIRTMVEHRGLLVACTHNGFVTSADAGATWTDMAATWPVDCSKSGISQPIGLQASSDALYTWCQLSGPWRSTDAGVTWTNLRTTPPGTIPDPLVDAAFGVNLAAVLVGLPAGGAKLLATTDLGVTWTECEPPTLPPGVQFFCDRVSIGTADVLYVTGRIVGAPGGFMTFRSTDQGATWNEVTAFTGMIPRVVAVKDVDLSTVTIMRSEDAGETWSAFHNGAPDAGMWHVAVVGQHLVASSEVMIFRIPMDQVTSVDESVRGSRFAVRDEQYMRGSVPYTTLRVDRDVTVDMFNVLGERVGSYQLEAGEHHLDTPMPTLLIMKPLRP